MFRLMSPISCTGCGYCMPCPNGVDIPRVFEYYSEAVNYNDVTRRRFMYNDPDMIKQQERADKCIKCKNCEEICPQKIPIPEMLEKAHAFLMERT